MNMAPEQNKKALRHRPKPVSIENDNLKRSMIELSGRPPVRKQSSLPPRTLSSRSVREALASGTAVDAIAKTQID